MDILTTDPNEINVAFRSFYSQLYASEAPDDTSDMSIFFSNLTIPKISPDDHYDLEMPINLNEITTAIHMMQSGKSLGPDGYPVEFFKQFSKQLASLLLEMFEDLLRQRVLPQSLIQASISLIPKKDKDVTNCSSWRPISLLNVDVKY